LLSNANLYSYSQEAITAVGDLEMDYMERRSVAMADHVVSPSRYLLGRVGSFHHVILQSKHQIDDSRVIPPCNQPK
jgi:hypothetical protein